MCSRWPFLARAAYLAWKVTTTEGQESIDGLDDLVDGLEENIGVDVGVLAVVRLGNKNTRHQREILGGLRDQGFSVPVVIGERGSLIEGCWKQQCSSYTYIKECSAWKREMSWTRLISLTNSPITQNKKSGCWSLKYLSTLVN
jgi:hypothetical protein